MLNSTIMKTTNWKKSGMLYILVGLFTGGIGIEGLLESSSLAINSTRALLAGGILSLIHI